MASLVLGVGGGVAGGAIGGAIAGSSVPIIGTLTGAAIGAILGGILGSAAGSVIDATLLFPALTGRKTTFEGQRLTDIPLTTASLGSPINFVLGRQNRIPGTVIWVSRLKSKQTTQHIGGKGGANVVNADYFVSVAVAMCEGPISSIRKVWADGILIYDENSNIHGGVDNRYTSITLYDGTQATADPIIQATEGADNVPAFVGISYFVIELLATGPWGNRIPNFTALVESQDQTLLADAVTAIWQRAGRPTSEIDVTFLAAEEVVGYNIVGPQLPSQCLEPLLLAYDVVMQEQNGITEFRRRVDSQVVQIDPNKLAAYEENTADPTRLIQVTDIPDYRLPKEVVVGFVDPAMFWQAGAQRQTKRSSTIPTQVTKNFPLVFTAETARSIAKRILWSNWAERWELSFTLSPSQLHLLESDLFQVDADGFVYNGRITSITRGQNYIIEVKAKAEQQSILAQQAFADVPSIAVEPEPLGQTTHTLVLMEIPILPGDQYMQGVHFSVAVSTVGDNWSGGLVYTSGGPLTGYAQWNEYVAESVIGIAAEALPADGSTAIWDMENSLTISMLNGELGSVSDDEVLSNWLNHMYVGKSDGTGEVIAFATVEQIDDVTYKISRLLRGRLGTEGRMSGHTTLEYACLLGGVQGAVHWVSTGQVGGTVYHKAHPAGNTPLSVLPVVSSQRINFAQTPWSPCGVRARRDVSNNLLINWSRRCNTPCNIFPSPMGTVPQNFPTLEYDFVSYSDITHSTVLGARRVLGNEVAGSQNSWTYTAAMQTTDGITPGDPVYMGIYQINADLGYNANRGVGTFLTL